MSGVCVSLLLCFCVCVLSLPLVVLGLCFSTLILSWTDTRPVVDNIKVAKCVLPKHNGNKCCWVMSNRTQSLSALVGYRELMKTCHFNINSNCYN